MCNRISTFFSIFLFPSFSLVLFYLCLEFCHGQRVSSYLEYTERKSYEFLIILIRKWGLIAKIIFFNIHCQIRSHMEISKSQMQKVGIFYFFCKIIVKQTGTLFWLYFICLIFLLWYSSSKGPYQRAT